MLRILRYSGKVVQKKRRKEAIPKHYTFQSNAKNIFIECCSERWAKTWTAMSKLNVKCWAFKISSFLRFKCFQNSWKLLHKKWSFPLRISSVNVTAENAGHAGNLQKNADLVTFTEEILNGKIHFLCSENNCRQLKFWKLRVKYLSIPIK